MKPKLRIKQFTCLATLAVLCISILLFAHITAVFATTAGPALVVELNASTPQEPGQAVCVLMKITNVSNLPAPKITVTHSAFAEGSSWEVSKADVLAARGLAGEGVRLYAIENSPLTFGYLPSEEASAPQSINFHLVGDEILFEDSFAIGPGDAFYIFCAVTYLEEPDTPLRASAASAGVASNTAELFLGPKPEQEVEADEEPVAPQEEESQPKVPSKQTIGVILAVIVLVGILIALLMMRSAGSQPSRVHMRNRSVTGKWKA